MTTHEINPHDMAHDMVDYGWAVLPLHGVVDGQCRCARGAACTQGPGKHPATKHGSRDASKDHAKVQQWFEATHANLGIATGNISGLMVLDVDGSKGEAMLAELVQQHGPLPETLTVRTGKGWHLYFKLPPDGSVRITSRATPKPPKNSGIPDEGGLDVRGEGGYVVAPPSLHVSGWRYEFSTACAPAPLPTWLAEFDPSRYGKDNGSPAPAKGSPPPPAAHATGGLLGDLGDDGRAVWSEREELRIRSALATIPAESRDVWVRIGAALHATGWGDRARCMFDQWASTTTADNFNEHGQETAWRSFDRPRNGARVTLATIIHMARENGWEEPADIPVPAPAANAIDNTGAPALAGRPAAEETPTTQELQTDLGNAKRFVKLHGKNIRYVCERKNWIVWVNDRWELDATGHIHRLAKSTVDKMFRDAIKLKDEERRNKAIRHAMASQSAARINAMIELARTAAEVVIQEHQLDADPLLLSVQNGVIDLTNPDEITIKPARRDQYITKRANVVCDFNAGCPNWGAFVHFITGGSSELQAYYQRVVGYTLTGLVCEEVMFELWGTGNNGKSTFRETLHTLIGDYATATDASLLVERKNYGGATPEVAQLKGARMVSINETPEGDKLNEAAMKKVTSQDTISARDLYAKPFQFMPSHKTFLSTNHKLVVKGTDIGTWRRIHLWPFTVTIPDADVDKRFRENKLIPELPGILNWALEGYIAYQKHGLAPPHEVRAATDDYRQDMDVVAQWLETRCEIAGGAETPSNLAYDDYVRWAQAEQGWHLSGQRFHRQLSEKGLQRAKRSHGMRTIVGLRLKSSNVASRLTVVAR